MLANTKLGAVEEVLCKSHGDLEVQGQLAVEVAAHHGPAPHVREPQAPVAPAGAFGEAQAPDQNLE